jgi:hypothetical protein
MRLGWTGLPGANTAVGILQNFVNYRQKKFYNIGPCQFTYACNKAFRFFFRKRFSPIFKWSSLEIVLFFYFGRKAHFCGQNV